MEEKVVDKRKESYDLYIGRGSKWGNPYRIGRDGDRAEVIRSYAEWITSGGGRHLLSQIGELEGKTLGCYCAPPGGVTAADPPVCHGQVLIWLVAKRREKLTLAREKGEAQEI